MSGRYKYLSSYKKQKARDHEKHNLFKAGSQWTDVEFDRWLNSYLSGRGLEYWMANFHRSRSGFLTKANKAFVKHPEAPYHKSNIWEPYRRGLHWNSRDYSILGMATNKSGRIYGAWMDDYIAGLLRRTPQSVRDRKLKVAKYAQPNLGIFDDNDYVKSNWDTSMSVSAQISLCEAVHERLKGISKLDYREYEQ